MTHCAHIPECLAGWEGNDTEGQEVPSCNGSLILGVVRDLANELAEDLIPQFWSLNAISNRGLNSKVSLVRLEISFEQFAEVLEDATRQVDVVGVMHMDHGGGEVAVLGKEKHICLWNWVLQGRVTRCGEWSW